MNDLEKVKMSCFKTCLCNTFCREDIVCKQCIVNKINIMAYKRIKLKEYLRFSKDARKCEI